MRKYSKLNPLLLRITLIAAYALIFVFLIIDLPAARVKKEKEQETVSSMQSNVQSISSQSSAITGTGQIVYGKSGLGVNLICNKISPLSPVNYRILLVFEIHGYEDEFARDGQSLVDMGNSVTAYFSSNRALLNGCELYIVPSANPDGLTNGQSKDGKGRCQISLGVNINRDFDFNFMVLPDPRDHTLDKPFSAPETCALRDLFYAVRPNVSIDDHGWLDELIGDKTLENIFSGEIGVDHLYQFTAKEHGFYSGWAGAQGAKSMLLEYPPAAAYNPAEYAQKTIDAITKLLSTRP